MRTPEESEVPKGFDLTVTHRDPKTGVIVRRDPYILRVTAAAEGGKSRLYERPAGSGNLWDRKGEPIGRWVIDEKTKRGKFVAGAPHIEFIPPKTADQKLAQSVSEKDVKIAELEKELAAIRVEKDKARSDSKVK